MSRDSRARALRSRIGAFAVIIAFVFAFVFAALATALVTGAPAGPRPGATAPTAAADRSAVYGVVRLDSPALRAGRVARGEVVFHNGSGRTQVVLRGCGTVAGLYAMALVGKSPQTSAYPAWAGVACRREATSTLVAKPGVTRYRFTVPTDYNGCTQGAPSSWPPTSRYWEPECLSNPHSTEPPLPAGGYRVEFETETPVNGVHVTPAALTITG